MFHVYADNRALEDFQRAVDRYLMLKQVRLEGFDRHLACAWSNKAKKAERSTVVRIGEQLVEINI